jgi:DNA repair exonuclease SbcCD ATPase subunit
MNARTSFVLVTVAALLSPVALAASLYRYTNEEGVTVVDYQVPAAYVGKGYEILNKDGVVVEVVPRELTGEEKKVRNAQQELEFEARAEERRLREWDESLLLRYSTIEDIEAARERALRDLRIRLSILKGNKRSLKQQVESYQAQAADLERSGREVDVARISAIEDIQAEIATTDRSINDRAEEIELVSAAYQKDIERFKQLLEVVELRQTMLARQRAEREKEEADPRR